MRTYLMLIGLTLLPLFASAQGTEFIPLTTLPGLKEVSDQSSLAPFLSQVYKICIGLAAVLAVLQLMRAGVMYMGGDSITEKKEARNLIGVTLAGLLLVLSPVIVFNIINPDILKLDINASALIPTDNADGTGSTAQTNSPPSNPTGDITSNPVSGGSFFYTFSSYSEAQADLYVTSCTTIPDDVKDIVTSRTAHKTVSQPKPAPAGKELADLYTVYCESTSRDFREFMLSKGIFLTFKVLADWKSLPKDEAAFSQFKNGCAANGGKMVQSTVSANARCSEDEQTFIDGIIASGGGKKVDSSCKSVTYSCKKPK